MKFQSKIKNIFLFLLTSFFSLSAVANTVALSNTPLDKATTGVVKPNILFVIDDSGSMSWTFMPDKARDFLGSYGYLSSQCNGVYYDPNVNYKTPPTKLSTIAVPINYTDASFTAAKDNGYSTSGSPATTNLDNNFYANRFEPEVANSSYSGYGSYTATPLGPSGAVYYEYTGSVTDKDYENSGSTFYSECDTTYNDATVGNTTTLGTRNLGAGAPFKRVRLATTETTFITISGTSNGDKVSSITVNGVELMSSSYTSTNSTNSTMANQVAAKISQNGFSATASSNVITITGPTSAAGYTPVITGTGLSFTTDVFPDTTAAKLTNFANWYSFYRTRMLMMKSAAGEAFDKVDSQNRMGLMKINSSNPTVYQDTFDNTTGHRQDWFEKLYATVANGGTPLRKSLTAAGRYYSGALSGTDPVQYSCQQNFTILSSDGYYNDNDSDAEMLDGSTQVGNQDGDVDRAMFDGSVLTGYANRYTRTTYSSSTRSCRRGQAKLITQPQYGSCQVATSGAACTPSRWRNDGGSSSGRCTNNLVVPNTTAPFLASSTASSNGGASNTLADVAMYYYKTDIRDSSLGNCAGDGSSTDVCSNGDANGVGGVFPTPRDKNKAQHMTTYTLGLANGYMKYVADYETAPGDYLGIRDASPATSTLCAWETVGDTCNWPIPSSGQPSTIDDLWHAAVNGRGAYFNANNPETLSTGIRSALFGITDTKGAASASSSSSLSPSPGDNASFIATYSTSSWKGNLESRNINLETGERTLSATWCAETIEPDNSCTGSIVAQTTGGTTIYNCETPATTNCADGGGILAPTGDATSGPDVCKIEVNRACTGIFTTQRKSPLFTGAVVFDDSDSRTIKTARLDTSVTPNVNVMTDFNTAFSSANPTYFNATTLSGLSQWTGLTATQQTTAVAKIAGYIRGHYGYDTHDTNNIPADLTAGTPAVDNRLFRERGSVLGDILESKPTFNGKSRFSYGYPGYSAFKATQNAITAVADGAVYAGANDGMLHAFAAKTGVERWTYIPSMVVPNLWKLADNEYKGDAKHVNFVNGEVAISDVCTSSCDDTNNAVWKTILVGGLNGGGRGYYALDITNPTSPALLWEFTTTNGIGAVQDDDLGYSYAKPVIARKPDNTWVILVTSGYNNVSPGSGKGFLFALDAGSGAIVSKVSTGVGDTTTPSGLAKIAGWNNNPKGNEIGDIYGGDLLGNVWKFDIYSATPAVSLFTTLTDSSSTPQPITTTPILASKGQQRLVMVATGKFLESGDMLTSNTQSVYAITDDNTGPLANPRTQLVQQIIVTDTAQDTRTIATLAPVNLATKRGWFVDFPISAERVVKELALTEGVLYALSYIPSATQCSPGGDGWFNYFNYATGGSVAGFVGVKMRAPGAGLSITYGPDGANVDVTFNDGGSNVLGPKGGAVAGSFTGKRTLWRELMQ